MENKKIAEQLFLNKTKTSLDDIKSITFLNQGYSNDNFLIQLNNKQKYVVRITKNNDVIDRKLERAINKVVKTDEYTYFDCNTGNYIKRFIDGRNPNWFEISLKRNIDKVCNIISNFQQYDIKNIDVPNQEYQSYIDKSKNYLQKYQLDAFVSVIEKHKNLDNVLCHTDVSKWNLILNKNKMTLIDWEWASKNNKYWDYGNFIRVSSLSYKKIIYIAKRSNLDLATLIDITFAAACFGYMWTFIIEQDEKIIKYQKKAKSSMNKYYNIYCKYGNK